MADLGRAPAGWDRLYCRPGRRRFPASIRPGDGTRPSGEATRKSQRFPGNREATLQRARTRSADRPVRRLAVGPARGAQDRWVPVADAFRFQNDIKAAKLEVFDKLGHDPMEEDPMATAAAVAAFLKPIISPPPFPPRTSPLEIGSRQRAK